MPADGFCSRSSITRSMLSGDISGSSPCTLTRMSARGSLRATSATRSVPLAQSGLVITKSPRNRSTSRAISAWSVAMSTPVGLRAAQAASYVCCRSVLPVSPQQHLPRQPGGGVAGRDDDIAAAADGFAAICGDSEGSRTWRLLRERRLEIHRRRKLSARYRGRLKKPGNRTTDGVEYPLHRWQQAQGEVCETNSRHAHP